MDKKYYFDDSFLLSLTRKNRLVILLKHYICQTKSRPRIVYDNSYVWLFYYSKLTFFELKHSQLLWTIIVMFDFITKFSFFQKQDIIVGKLNHFWIVEIPWIEQHSGTLILTKLTDLCVRTLSYSQTVLEKTAKQCSQKTYYDK